MSQKQFIYKISYLTSSESQETIYQKLTKTSPTVFKSVHTREQQDWLLTIGLERCPSENPSISRGYTFNQRGLCK